MIERATLWQNWEEFIQPFDDSDYQPPALYRIERRGNSGWFTHYAKPAGESLPDSPDLEFRITRVIKGGAEKAVQIERIYKFVYDSSSVARLAGPGENAYEILSTYEKDGVSWMTVKFYELIVDTKQRLPKLEEVLSTVQA